MSLLDRLRDAQDEPARHRASPWVGPSILSVGQLRAMERALAREGFFDRDISVPEEPPLSAELLPTWSPPAPMPVTAAVVPMPPPLVVEPLPLWTPPAAFDPCRNCGEEVTIDRIDLTVDATWITCRACGLRWDGPRDRKSGERGQIAAG